jgi:hypothetical protein
VVGVGAAPVYSQGLNIPKLVSAWIGSVEISQGNVFKRLVILNEVKSDWRAGITCAVPIVILRSNAWILRCAQNDRLECAVVWNFSEGVLMDIYSLRRRRFQCMAEVPDHEGLVRCHPETAIISPLIVGCVERQRELVPVLLNPKDEAGNPYRYY